MQVLLLEPDFWRFLGISQILGSEPGIVLLGEEDHNKILGLRSVPPELKPDVVIVSHSLVLDYYLSVLQHLQTLFPKAHLLVEGYDQTLDGIANVLRAGAKGYFLLSSDPEQLLKALKIVQKGFIWAPREALVLLAQQALDDRTKRFMTASQMLTTAERSILMLLQQGLSNKEIGNALGVAEVTVKSHLTKLYRRFGVHSRLELLTYALNHHLLTDAFTQTAIRESHH